MREHTQYEELCLVVLDLGDTDECVEWWRHIDRCGYGRVWAKKFSMAHRVAYELVNGPVPDGLQVDHLCSNPPCINPRHLEAVTQLENNRRIIERGRPYPRRPAKTHCPQGHPFDEANTRWFGNQKLCKVCNNEASRRYRARSRQCT